MPGHRRQEPHRNLEPLDGIHPPVGAGCCPALSAGGIQPCARCARCPCLSCTGPPPTIERGVQVRHVPSPLKPGTQGDPEVRRVPGAVGAVGWGGVHRVLRDPDRGVQVRHVPGPLEPGSKGAPEV
jgi:hypothetical protein